MATCSLWDQQQPSIHSLSLIILFRVAGGWSQTFGERREPGPWSPAHHRADPQPVRFKATSNSSSQLPDNLPSTEEIICFITGTVNDCHCCVIIMFTKRKKIFFLRSTIAPIILLSGEMRLGSYGLNNFKFTNTTNTSSLSNTSMYISTHMHQYIHIYIHTKRAIS